MAFLFYISAPLSMIYCVDSKKITFLWPVYPRVAILPFYPSFLRLMYVRFCSLVWKETNEEDIFSITGRTSSSLPWIWMESGTHKLLKWRFCPPFPSSFLTNVFLYDMIWQTNNILAPIITHGIYSATILGHGLWKIHDHRRRLRQRVQQLNLEDKNSRNFWN